jgi:7-cyano-7-deazaguanine reductase
MDIPLGRSTDYGDTYAPELLVPMSRAEARAAIGLEGRLPFAGEDVWNGYEFSWLDPRGIPQVAGLRFAVRAHSPYFVESKSLKLYLNGFAQSKFADRSAVAAVLARDLSHAFGAELKVELPDLARLPAATARLPGRCLDDLAVPVDRYERAPDLLALETAPRVVTNLAVHTHVFRSLCPVTGQPDWASVLVRYSGPAISAEALWRYLVSYRRHPAFHETTIEQIFLDLKARCRCTQLLVAGFFQRRGGLDINPVRSDGPRVKLRFRLPRQ